MKYCPYCGAVLLDSAVSFCSECGKALPGKTRREPKPEQAAEITEPETEAAEEPSEEMIVAEAAEPCEVIAEKTVSRKKTGLAKKKKAAKKSQTEKKAVQPEKSSELEKPADDYDGYYEDVRPVDEGRLKEGLDQNLIKKIILLAASALLIVGACVALMYLL